MSYCFHGIKFYQKLHKVLIKYSVKYPSTGRQVEGELKLGELIEECSDGHMKMEFYPSSQLWDKTATFESLGNGTIEMTECAATALSAFNDMWSAFCILPAVFVGKRTAGLRNCYGPGGPQDAGSGRQRICQHCVD